MSNFQVSFISPPNSVLPTVVDGSAELTVESTPDSEHLKIERQVAQSLQSIANHLKNVSQAVKLQDNQLSHRGLAYATTIVRELVGDTPELYETRLQRSFEIALPGIDATKLKISVHPNCLPFVEEHLANYPEIELDFSSDSSLLPGDCHIELEDTGFMTSLDLQIESIQQRIRTGDLNVEEGNDD